ncbi:MAG: class I SAM-dependent methyltransferase [Nanoarchaeota archaeon]|nr:class I SAM-dependent methyltransferase [Nanoarchaeota archaeon]MBU1028471.1 class I SAM-dependent methyltransferase [Nanoarchaeota archaeon]
MEKEGYKKLAKYYDEIYQNKDYSNEIKFLIEILNKHNSKKILDVGCGTGTHISLLEKADFECTGIDLNIEMLKIANKKVKAKLLQANMSDFNIDEKFDAIICMFASFNHLLSIRESIKALRCFYKHLKKNGILILDLHNSKTKGSKEDNFKNIYRKMSWDYNSGTKIETTKVVFRVPEGLIEDKHLMRIFSINEMNELLSGVGFKNIQILGGYKQKVANGDSKNLEVIGQK